jgi:SAM-dependent methyltransferase
MNSSRYSRIAHRYLPFSAPISEETVSGLLEFLPLDGASTVLDVGCGRAELLLRVAERFSLRAVGIDNDAEVLEQARETANQRGLGDRVSLVEGSATEVDLPEKFDLSICIGASHALSGYLETIDFLQTLTKKGGYLLLGEGFWRRPPDPEYLAAFGGRADEMTAHYENIATARSAGLNLVWSMVSTDTDWDRYEGLYRFAMHRHLTENPEDPEAESFSRRSEEWHDAYQRWGRSTMGFALYLFHHHRQSF